MTFGTEKRGWFAYPVVKKNEDTITLFDRIHERDGHMDEHRMTA